jgi:hypothetical protein
MIIERRCRVADEEMEVVKSSISVTALGSVQPVKARLMCENGTSKLQAKCTRASPVFFDFRSALRALQSPTPRFYPFKVIRGLCTIEVVRTQP